MDASFRRIFHDYPSDLSDSEWQILEPILCAVSWNDPKRGRPRSWSLREIVNAVFYLVRAGCAWRLLPREYPPWQTVYTWFRKWKRDGTWERVHAALRERSRKAAGREPTPSGAAVDSQSVRTTDRGGVRGYDGFKKISGRKRHIVTDTTGLVLKVSVHAANIHDGNGSKQLLAELGRLFERLAIIWADQAYRGEEMADWVAQHTSAKLEVVERTTKQQKRDKAMAEAWKIARERIQAGASTVEAWAGISLDEKIDKQYEHLPRRWVVERTFAWLGRNRRMSKDYELLTETSETLVYIVMTRLMLRRMTEEPKPEKGRKRVSHQSARNI